MRKMFFINSYPTGTSEDRRMSTLIRILLYCKYFGTAWMYVNIINLTNKEMAATCDGLKRLEDLYTYDMECKQRYAAHLLSTIQTLLF